jgi:hypothetical protein
MGDSVEPDQAAAIQANAAIVQAITATVITGLTVFLTGYTVATTRRTNAAERSRLAEDRVSQAVLLNLEEPFADRVPSVMGLVIHVRNPAADRVALGVRITLEPSEGDAATIDAVLGDVAPGADGGEKFKDGAEDWYQLQREASQRESRPWEVGWKAGVVKVTLRSRGIQGQTVTQRYEWLPDAEGVGTVRQTHIDIDPGVPGEAVRHVLGG